MIYVCAVCAMEEPEPLALCPGCHEVNSYVSLGQVDGGDEEGGALMLDDVEPTEDVKYRTGIRGLDEALDGGLSECAFTLLVGEPGIGKSTLLLQIGHALCDVARTLYVSSEEPLGRVRGRASGLGNIAGRVLVMYETDSIRLREAVRMVRPVVLLVDSLHGLATSTVTGRPGSIQQTLEAASALRDVGRKEGASFPVTVLASCHVVKDGSLAGPKDLEHLVDVVLWMEGDPGTPTRTLRANKNRFGATTVHGVVVRGEGGFR